jgi:hypothetical protein
MKRKSRIPKRLLKLLAPMAVVGALFVAPAMASAVTIEGAVSGLPIAEGAGLTATSGALVFTSSTGVSIECTESELNGTVSSNGGATATVTVENGRFEGGGPLAGSCPTNIGAPAFISTNLTPLEHWILHLLGAGSWTLTNVQFTATLITGPETQVNCTFRGAEEEEGEGIGMISGTYTEAPALTELTATEAPFTLVAGPAELCGATGELNGTFQTESEGEGIVTS